MITDFEGQQSDALQIELVDGPPTFVAIPSARAVIRVWGGYRDGPLASFSAFSDADVSVRCLPYSFPSLPNRQT